MIMKTIEEIKITAAELKKICDEYKYNPEEHLLIDEDEDERPYLIKKALSELEKSDYIIFCLYMEFKSERKVANILGCSRTPVHNSIKKIKEQIAKKLCI